MLNSYFSHCSDTLQKQIFVDCLFIHAGETVTELGKFYFVLVAISILRFCIKFKI